MRVQIDCPHPETQEIPNDDCAGGRPWFAATVYVNDVPHHLTLLPVQTIMGRQKTEPGYTKWFKGMKMIDTPEQGYQTIAVDGTEYVCCLTPFEKG